MALKWEYVLLLVVLVFSNYCSSGQIFFGIEEGLQTRPIYKHSSYQSYNQPFFYKGIYSKIKLSHHTLVYLEARWHKLGVRLGGQYLQVETSERIRIFHYDSASAITFNDEDYRLSLHYLRAMLRLDYFVLRLENTAFNIAIGAYLQTQNCTFGSLSPNAINQTPDGSGRNFVVNSRLPLSPFVQFSVRQQFGSGRWTGCLSFSTENRGLINIWPDYQKYHNYADDFGFYYGISAGLNYRILRYQRDEKRMKP